MKKSKNNTRSETELAKRVVSDRQAREKEHSEYVQWKDNANLLSKIEKRFGGFGPPEKMEEDRRLLNDEYQPLATDEQLKALDRFYTQELPKLTGKVQKPEQEKDGGKYFHGVGAFTGFDKTAPWIQTHSGRRFCPTNPNPDSIVIQDIAHALSMICRFGGHSSRFYSVGQHSVLVSYICDSQDALYGLMHDSSEAFCGDFSSPLKHSGLFNGYIEMETKIQQSVCKRFGLPMQEPDSVKRADKVLLATEGRDLMLPRRQDWISSFEPLPFNIEPWSQQEAKDRFIKRFFDLTGEEEGYKHYLKYKNEY